MAECFWRCQNDHSVARPPHAPLRYRRDRQRQLALQEPRLSLATERPELAPVGPQEPPARAASASCGHSATRGSPLWTTGTSHQHQGQFWAPIAGQYLKPIDKLRDLKRDQVSTQRALTILEA